MAVARWQQSSLSATLPATSRRILSIAVASLVDKSLLRQAEDGPGEPRFPMLETIREYARERLVASGEEETDDGSTQPTISRWRKQHGSSRSWDSCRWKSSTTICAPSWPGR